MSRYKLTGRGWALAFVVAALLFVGTYALVSFAFNGEPPEDNPSDGPHLSGQTPDSATPDVPPVTPTEGGQENSPPAPTQPNISAGDTPPPSVLPPSSPPPPDNPSPSPAEPSPSPAPVEPSPSPLQESAPPAPVSPAPPAPSSAPPAWVDERLSFMFGFDSAEPLEPEQYLADLAEFLPSLNELNGYLIIVNAYTAADETVEDLAALRGEAVHTMLTALGIPGSMIRVIADPVSHGTERYRQRADISFLYVGNK